MLLLFVPPRQPPLSPELFYALVRFSVHSMNCFKCFNAAATSEPAPAAWWPGRCGGKHFGSRCGRSAPAARSSSLLSSWIFQFCVPPCTQTIFQQQQQQKNVIIVTIMAAVLPRGSLFKNTEGWRKTKCRYVLTLEQKAMKWIKTRTKQTNTQTNRKKTKLYFCKRDVLLLKRYWRTCIYGSKDHSSISQNSYYWLVLICWLTKCFERRLASCYCLTLTRAFPCFAVSSVPFLLHLGSVQRPSFHCDREREVIKARGAPGFLFCSVLLPFLIL